MKSIGGVRPARKCCVYLATNTVNGKLYVGKAMDLARRQNEHLGDARRDMPRSALGRAIRKYGRQAFTFDVLEEYESEDDALWWEGWWIQYLSTKTPHGYNVTDGGRGAVGVVFSPERRKKISEALTGKKLSEAHRRALSESHQGHRPSAEAIEKSRLKNIGQKRSPETREKIAAKQRGHHRPWSERRRKAQPAVVVVSIEHRGKLSVALKGKPWTEARRVAQASVSMERSIEARHRARGTAKAAKAPLVTVNGETLSRGGWAIRNGLTVGLIATRIRRGWTEERAVTEPIDISRRNKPR